MFSWSASTGDVEDDKGPSYTYWPREAILYLISLYKDYEDELEDRRKKKKDVWAKITNKMHEKGYKFRQSKIESKWCSLLQSHKDVKDNMKTTGGKCKRFQHFEQING